MTGNNWKGVPGRPKGTKRCRGGKGICVREDEREGVWAIVNLPGFEL